MAEGEALVAQHRWQRVAEDFGTRCCCLLVELLEPVAPAAVGGCQLTELLLSCKPT
jgi:hypothetical protein